MTSLLERLRNHALDDDEAIALESVLDGAMVKATESRTAHRDELIEALNQDRSVELAEIEPLLTKFTAAEAKVKSAAEKLREAEGAVQLLRVERMGITNNHQGIQSDLERSLRLDYPPSPGVAEVRAILLRVLAFTIRTKVPQVQRESISRKWTEPSQDAIENRAKRVQIVQDAIGALDSLNFVPGGELAGAIQSLFTFPALGFVPVEIDQGEAAGIVEAASRLGIEVRL